MAAGLKPNLNVIRVKAEKGLNIVRSGAISTIEIDLVNNNISYTIGNVKLDIMGFGDYKYPRGPCSVGVSKNLFKPYFLGVTWKVGCENKSTFISIGTGLYKYQNYLEFLVEGDLTNTGRFKYTLYYAVGLAGIVAGIVVLAKAAVGFTAIQVLKILRPDLVVP